MPNTVVYANILPFIATVFVLFFVRINPLFDKRQNKLFVLSSITILFMMVIISVDYTLSLGTWKYAWVVRRITSFFNFAFSSALPIYLINIFKHKKMNKFLYLPAAANFIICAVSIFVKLVFFFPPEGGYERGPLFLFPPIVAIFYIVVLLAESIKERKQRAYEAIFLFGVIAGFLLSLYLETIKYFKFLSWDFAAMFLVLYYLLLNINKSKIDPLTGANNRAMYVQRTASLNHSRRCVIAMIDINEFKVINDEKGHAEGDKILVNFVSIAQSYMDKKNVLYRIGGDEFAIISEDASVNDLKERLAGLFIKLTENNISCAAGVIEYDPAVDIESAIRTADMEMYKNKRQYYNDMGKEYHIK